MNAISNSTYLPKSLACAELFCISEIKKIIKQLKRRERNVTPTEGIQQKKPGTWRWLLTWYIVKPSTFMSFSTPLGVASEGQDQ